MAPLTPPLGALIQGVPLIYYPPQAAMELPQEVVVLPKLLAQWVLHLPAELGSLPVTRLSRTPMARGLPVPRSNASASPLLSMT